VRPLRAQVILAESIVTHLRAAGALVLLAPPDEAPGVDALLEGIDGVVITGGAHDIHPRHYGQDVTARLDRVEEGRAGLELPLAYAPGHPRLPARAQLLVDDRRSRRVDRRQLADLVDRMVVDRAERGVQVLSGVQAVQAATSDQRKQRRCGLGAALGPCEQPVLSADDRPAKLELAHVVVDRDRGVARADLEGRPLVQRVGGGLADGARRSLFVHVLDEPDVDTVEGSARVRRADASSRFGIGVLQGALDVEEDADPRDRVAGEGRAALLGVDEVAAGV
jgi:hypothetical protein